MTRKFLILALAPLLWACPPKDEDATVRWQGGRPIFDADRTDCLSRVTVTNPAAGYARVSSVENPGYRGSDPDCPLRFPIAYGASPAGTRSDPADAPPLTPGARYAFRAEGATSDYSVDFTVPAAE